MNRTAKLKELVDALLKANERLYCMRDTPEWHTPQGMRVRQNALAVLALHLKKLRAITDESSKVSSKSTQ